MKPFRPEFGVFETMRNYSDEIFKLDEHLARLAKSADIVQMELPKSLEEIRAQLLDLQLDGPTKIRLVATPEEIVIETYPIEIDPKIYEGVSAISVPIERNRPEAKAFPYNASLDAHAQAEKLGHYEAFLVDHSGYVREGAYSNIFWVTGDEIHTAQEGVLAGITRQVIIDSAPVKFADITPEKLIQVDEIFITKTSTGIVPITELDGHKIGIGEPGPVTEKLAKIFPPEYT